MSEPPALMMSAFSKSATGNFAWMSLVKRSSPAESDELSVNGCTRMLTCVLGRIRSARWFSAALVCPLFGRNKLAAKTRSASTGCRLANTVA